MTTRPITARLLKFRRTTEPRKGAWPRQLAAPIHVADTEAKARAASILAAVETRDGRPTYPSDLTPEQARDVCRWAT